MNKWSEEMNKWSEEMNKWSEEMNGNGVKKLSGDSNIRKIKIWLKLVW